MASLGRWKLPKARSGRRPLRISTLLKKELDGSLFKKHAEDRIPGGLADDKSPMDFPRALLAQGRKVEREHTRSGAIATEIAMDHLTEDKDYYDKLEKVEKSAYALQGSTKLHGLDIAIENAVGSVRKGTNEDGSEWKTKFKSPYGYIRGTKGSDGEEVDCYVGPKRDADTAYVVHQKNDDGSHDEDTVMLGYGSKADAKADILRHYDDPKYVGSISSIAISRLKDIVEDGKKIEKISAPTHDHTFIDGPDPGVTGAPAPLRRHRLEPPARDEVDPHPTPKVEERGNIAQTIIKGEFTPAGGFEDVGKTSAKFAAAMETLGQLSRSWEVPSDDSAQGGHQRSTTGGLVDAPAAERMSHNESTRGPFHLSLGEISTQVNSDEASTKGAAVTHRFPKADRVEDNTLDVRKAGDQLAELDAVTKSATAFGFGPDGEFYVNGELVPVREHRGEKLAHVALQGFFDTLEKNASVFGAPLWTGDFDAFRKVAMEVYYNVDMPITKEALGLAGIGQGIKNVAGRLRPGAAAGAMPEVAAMRKGMGFFSTGMGRDLQASGKMLSHNPQAAGRAAGLGAKDLGALQAMRPTSAVRRIAGETAQGAGHHMAHAGPATMALNPAGVPLGGAIEGFARGVGKEMAGSGRQAVQTAGQALQKHAPKVGFGGELLAGGLMHLPSFAGMAGAQLAPAAGGAAQHLLGAGVQEATTRAPKLLPRAMQVAKGVAGRLA